MINWPDRIIRDIARRRAIVVLGAGASRNCNSTNGSKPPTWRGFLEKCLVECEGKTTHIAKKIKEGDYLTACELLMRRLPDKWENLLRREFLTPRYTAGAVHELIFKLDLKTILTSNIDKIYDNYVTAKTDGTTAVKTYYDEDIIDYIQRGDPIVIKAHGTIDRAGDLVFTLSQYASARVKNEIFYSFLNSLIETNTFVFVGSGLSDPDFRLLFEQYAFKHRFGRPHYMLSADKMHADEIDIIRKTRNIEIIKYPSADNHAALVPSLERLNQLVDAAREEIAVTKQW